MIDDDHCAVAKIGDALVRIAASGDDFDFSAFTREILIAKSEGESVEVQGVDMLGGGDFGKIVVIGEDEAAVSFREFHQAVVDRSAIELIVEDSRIEEDNAFEFAHSVETGAGTEAFFGIFTICEELELVGDAARNYDIIADEAGFGDFDEARVHQGRSVNVNLALLISGDKRVFTTFEHEDCSFAQNDKRDDKYT